MSLDLDQLDQKRQRWVPMTGHLQGVEILVTHASPRESERFRQKLVRLGVMRQDRNGGGFSIANGRQDDFFRLFAEQYVLDWRGDIRPEGAEYSSDKMGQVLGAYNTAFELLSSVISEDADFFVSNGAG